MRPRWTSRTGRSSCRSSRSTTRSSCRGTIARAVGIVETGVRPPMELLVELLADERVLIVLDNFERLTAAGPVIGDLLRAAPGLAVHRDQPGGAPPVGRAGVPARRAGGPPGRRPAHAGAADGPGRRCRPGHGPPARPAYGAVQLFVERARAGRPTFELDATNAAAVARICARLDGMPLAIELAAARIRLLSPDAILIRLERQFELLASAARDVPERQRTLRGAIAWSYDLLDDPSRHLLERLACFVGGTRPRDGRGGLRPGRRARPRRVRRHRRARRPEPRPPVRGRRRDPLLDARHDPRLRPRATRGAGRAGRDPAAPRAGVPRTGPDGRAAAVG